MNPTQCPHCPAIIIKLFQLLHYITHILSPIAWLMARMVIAQVFFNAGLAKIDDMDSTLLLFEHEYQVPLLPVTLAAYSATFFELVMPVLIVFGIATRLAVIPLLVMTAVIQFTYLQHMDHLYWSVILGLLMVNGAGKLSVDHWVCSKKCRPAS